MSTPNFYNKNASKIFACEVEKEYDYEDLIENIKSDKRLKKYTEEKNKYEDGLRSYGGVIFANRQIWKGIWIINIDLIVRSGYYSGVNLDWTIHAEKDTAQDYWDDEVQPEDENLPQYIQTLLRNEVTRIEKVYQDYSTPLNCVGIFSNGEAIYEKA